jgi:hypothetical protein
MFIILKKMENVTIPASELLANSGNYAMFYSIVSVSDRNFDSDGRNTIIVNVRETQGGRIQIDYNSSQTRVFDENGERVTAYEVLDLNPETNITIRPMASATSATSVVNNRREALKRFIYQVYVENRTVQAYLSGLGYDGRDDFEGLDEEQYFKEIYDKLDDDDKKKMQSYEGTISDIISIPTFQFARGGRRRRRRSKRCTKRVLKKCTKRKRSRRKSMKHRK